MNELEILNNTETENKIINFYSIITIFKIKIIPKNEQKRYC